MSELKIFLGEEDRWGFNELSEHEKLKLFNQVKIQVGNLRAGKILNP